MAVNRLDFKRALSAQEADRCENAKYPACDCRCGGAFHGMARIAAISDEPTKSELEMVTNLYRALPSTDPHHLPTFAEMKRDASDRRQHRRSHRQAYAGVFYDGGAYVDGAFRALPHRICPMCLAEGKPSKDDYNAAIVTDAEALADQLVDEGKVVLTGTPNEDGNVPSEEEPRG